MGNEVGSKNLDIIVTHYKEPWEVGKKLFDSIAIQECIDFKDINVIVVNDGEDHGLPESCFTGLPYTVKQMSIKKGGVSKARNAGLDAATADWVMFCDFDDCYSSVFALYMIFCAMHEDQYDTLWSCFTEETKDSEGKITLVSHEHDYVFIHGKAHRREFLLENGIRFHPKLTIHEDVFFNMLTQMVCKPERVGSIKTPIYCWRWNGNSVVRKDKNDDFVLMTYDHLIRQRMALIEELLKREMNEQAMTIIVKTVVDTYYDCQQSTWRTQDKKQAVRNAENWFAAFLKRYAGYYVKADTKVIAGMVKSCRENVLRKGTFLIEAETLSQWLQHIMDTAKPIPKWEQDI